MRFAKPGFKPESPVPSSLPPFQHPVKTVAVKLWMVVALAAGLALSMGALVFLLVRPVAPIPTFEKSVEAYLHKRQAEPSPARVAFAQIQKSFVVIQAQQKARSDALFELGAGVIVEDTGTILTCLHVIDGATGIRITFSDGFETGGIVVRTQRDNDLAVLRPEIVPEDLQPATFGSSADLQIGDPVVAVGNPFGLIDSVSQGVVSGKDRSAAVSEKGPRLHGLIQFDAAVNPGNSGGPLLNRQGEVVGLVTALFNPTSQSFFVGIGYAITIETAGRMLDIPPW